MSFRNLLIGELNLKRLMLSLVLIPLLIYIGLGLYAYLFADRLIFQPQPVSYRRHESIIKIAASNKEQIAAVFFENPAAEFTILFSHGNAEDIIGSSNFFKELSAAGFNVLAYDYRGYGVSDGKPSESNSYEDAEAAYNYLTNDLRIPPDRIIIHGRSLGAAVSIDLAARKPCGGLIAESAFVSAFRVLTRYPIYPFDKFSNLDKISRVKCQVLFIHGRKDEIIPFWHGLSLHAVASEPKYSFWIDEAGHNNVFEVARNDYLQAIKNFSANSPKK